MAAPMKKISTESIFGKLKEFVKMFINKFEQNLSFFEVIEDSDFEAEFEPGKDIPKSENIITVLQQMEKKALRKMLADVAGELFYCFQSQFVKVSLFDDRGLYKLAGDAVSRAIWFLQNKYNQENSNGLSSELLATEIIRSQTTRHIFLKMKGTKTGIPFEWRAANFYNEVGLLETGKYYISKKCNAAKYGYRRLLHNETIPEGFNENTDPEELTYQYILTSDLLREHMETIISEMTKDDPKEMEFLIDEDVAAINMIVAEMGSNTVPKISEEQKHEIQLCIRILHNEIETLTLLTKDLITCNVHKPVNVFSGRDKELKTIQEELLEDQSVAICGLGGIGKSELARKYAYDFYGNHNRIWIDSQTTESIRTSFQSVANQLGIAVTGKHNQCEVDRDIKDIVRDVYERFVKLKCLFIFDNAENFNEIKDMMPWLASPGQQSPHVLITSRHRNWNIREAHAIYVIELDEFTTDEAMKFVKASLNISENYHESDGEINELSQLLVYFPLALSQATSYINENGNSRMETYTIKDYIRELKNGNKRSRIKILNYQSGTNSETILSTWQRIFKKSDKLSDVELKALEMVKIMAYLNPENIPVRRYFFKNGDDLELFRNAIVKLHEYFIVKMKKGNATINRLVQDEICLLLQDEGKEETVLKDVLNINFCLNEKDEPNYKADSIHMLSVWTVAKKYESLVKEFILERDPTDKESLIKVLNPLDIHEQIRIVEGRLEQSNIPV